MSRKKTQLILIIVEKKKHLKDYLLGITEFTHRQAKAYAVITNQLYIVTIWL